MRIYFIFLFLISCNVSNEKKDDNLNITKSSNTLNISRDSIKPKIINFRFNDFKEIDNYKAIDLNSSIALYDNYVIPATRNEIDCFNTANKSREYNDEGYFFVETDYGKVKFESIDEGDAFFQYYNNSTISNYYVINVNTIDITRTIFLNKEKYNGFITAGKVYFSESKNYFISVDNESDFCILEIYEIQKNRINNIINLYSKKIQIDNICWNKALIFETPEVDNSRNSYRIDFEKILLDFKLKH